MTDWRKKIDPKTSALLKKAARCQMELGTKEVVLSRTGVKRRRKELTPKSSQAAAPTQYASLEEHNKSINSCRKCPLGETRTKFVYGVGNPQAGVLFIGEAPGRDEDLQGEPFVGRAGQLLDKILASIKFSRQDVYIANMLKCRPPNNRDPQPDEMAICLPYLMEQVRLIKPNIICALGRISAQALLQTTTPIGKLRKIWHEFDGIPLIVTYHPAALLRFESYKKDVWDDVRMLRAKYDELTSGI
ncbi:MAG: uracil-DNA glycosylase [candidate division Zixibacteria bacterium]|nr:uracil-DNA glycosylase [candidate division Zixibacteria bacterium]